MSEKFKVVWRKVKEGVSLGLLFLPIMLLSVVLWLVMILIIAAIEGAIAGMFWNLSMPTMFSFSNITIFQAFVLSFTIGCLRKNYFDEINSEYKDLKDKIFERSKKEKISKIIAVILSVIFEIISMYITVFATKYSWNEIIPELINVELVQIDSAQAFGFAYMFKVLFGHNSKSDNNKSKNDENTNSKEELSESKDDNVSAKITENNID